MSSTTSGLRPHNTVDACVLTIAAMVVPHDPAPMTATVGTGRTAVAYEADVDGSRVDGAMTQAGVVVPIRAFALGKARLAARLDGNERAALARRLAARVVDAAGELPVVVVSSDPLVRARAESR